MQLIDRITVQASGQERDVVFAAGDLSALSAADGVDLLVVSAFPGDYTPVPHTLIGALQEKGVSVVALAADKDVDLRSFSSCWLSKPIDRPDVHFRRILCFEPGVRGRAPELVGDLFRSLMPFCGGSPPIDTIAMPLLGTGDQGESRPVMLHNIAEAAVQWLENGLPLRQILVVASNQERAQELAPVFRELKAKLAGRQKIIQPPRRTYDAFLSYSHREKEQADHLAAALRKASPSINLFIDSLELNPGSAWQQRIFDALEDCDKVITLLSPSYLASKVCMEEYHIARFRHIQDGDVLLPIWLSHADLPVFMQTIQWQDARESDLLRLGGIGAELGPLFQ